MSCSYIIISDQIHNSKILLSSLTLWRRISSLLLKTHFHPVLITSDRSTVKACEHRSLSLSARTKLSWQPSRETERNECQMGAGCVSADGGAGETEETGETGEMAARGRRGRRGRRSSDHVSLSTAAGRWSSFACKNLKLICEVLSGEQV